MTEPSQILFRAQTSASAVPQLSADDPLDLPTAYRIQRAVAELRHAAGERPTGFKMGFTSRAKMQQMGVDEVIGGLLSSSMAWLDGDIVDPATLIRPRIEPEVVFRLGRDIDPGENL